MYVSSITALIEKLGDYFLPNIRFVVEQVSGNHLDPNTYRNRVNYGAKVAVRLGPNHTLALNVPTDPNFTSWWRRHCILRPNIPGGHADGL
jgi:hypothetical protein